MKQLNFLANLKYLGLVLLVVLAIAAIFFLSGCSALLVKDCEQQGESQYYHCKRVWIPTR